MNLDGGILVNADLTIVGGNTVTGSRKCIFLDAQKSKNKVESNSVFKSHFDISNADCLPLTAPGLL